MLRIIYRRQYGNTNTLEPAPAWLVKKAEQARAMVRQDQETTLWCADTPGAALQYGSAACSPAWYVTFEPMK